jgi:outer membrane protein assembly factor BamB
MRFHCSALIPGLILAGTLPGQEWTRFRGPNGSGIGEAKTIPVRFSEKDFNWKVKLPGIGHSSPVVWGQWIFVTSGDDDGKRSLLCLKAEDGTQVWVREFPGQKHGRHSDNSYASATPAVDGRQVYTCWGNPKEYLVVAHEHDGKEAWRIDLGSYRSGHGFGASPIVHDGLLIVPNDQDGPSSLVALECATGKVRWKIPRKAKATYTTPCIYQPRSGAAEIVVTNYEHGISSIDPKNGKVNWELDLFDKRHIETSIGSPIVAGDLILGLSGWLGVRQEAVAVQRGEKPKEVYRITRGVPLSTTLLAVNDLLFLWTDAGMVSCADLLSGKIQWSERVPGSYYSSPICVGKHIYNISRDGEVVVLAASKEFELAARNRLGEGSHSTPAVAGGRMYLRTFGHLISVGGR